MKFVAKELKETGDISRAKSSRFYLLKNTAILVLGLFFLYQIIVLISGVAAEKVPDSWEAKVFADMIPLEEPKEKSIGFLRAEEIFAKILAAGPHRDLPYRLLEMDTEMVNAFAMAGGHIAVTTGLLEKVKSEEGLAFVLAHELGHHERRHCLKQLTREVSVGLIFSVIFGDASGIQQSTQLMSLHYSRTAEEEADDFALDLCLKLYEPNKSFFELFDLISHDEKHSALGDFMRTHPYSQERISRLQKRFPTKLN